MSNLDAIWSDLTQWEASMNEKDAQLVRQKPIHNQKLPPVRKVSEIVVNDSLKPTGLESLSMPSRPKVEEKGKAPVNKGKEPASGPRMKPSEKALIEKDKGNACFQKQDFKAAITHYTKAVDFDPSNAVFFINRAMAYLKLQMYLEAEQDCTRGLNLHPTNVKALWRRGIARRALGRVTEARNDLTKALEIEPSNKSVKDELSKLPAPTSKKQEKPKIERKRLPIKIVDEAYPETTNTVKKQAVTPPKSKEPAVQATPSQNQPPPPPPPPTSAATKTTKSPTTKSEETKPSLTLSPISFNPPKTNIEFERDWKACRQRGLDTLYQYFQCIPPSSYESLFRSSLESDQFEQMIDLLETRYTKDKSKNEICNVLEGLTKVRRIDMLVMFLDRKHKSALEGLIRGLKGSVDDNALAKLSKVYDVKL
ncbi:rna polymerase ii-associated protein 3-like [Lichtheimia corymbifera JMRC:FSU:9682]|uniref:RNA polymerase II-associated protein 3 n=1 Tax=Lichtheimia corymbifera JMRC:FSU:9682 TaxID=1263082 RepID=A0A068RNL3_9FUNG|nr:rna polymerase ii-associated protein 3-like [Lichtheimia corymbifera JMRC:FSU:9682]